MMNLNDIPRVDLGSFRDPKGQVYNFNNRILRAVFSSAVADYEYVRSTRLLEKLITAGQLLPEERIDADILHTVAPDARYVLEHPRLPFVSYPYEWSFAALQTAARFHLELQLQALEHGVTLSDASAYNVQFRGAKPVFIDHLAFCRYQPGSIWYGYRQFCQQFLNPLLLRAYLGVPSNGMYRSSLEGISPVELRRLLPLYRKVQPKVFMHVVLQSSLQKNSNEETAKVMQKINLPLSGFRNLLQSLLTWITKLTPKDQPATIWQHYSKQHPGTIEKKALVAEFIARIQPRLVYDLGCNTGEYAKLALVSGAKTIIGFDSDHGALEQAFEQASVGNLDFLPLYMDLANPSPSQGWMETERIGLIGRGPADAILGLALIHHLAIMRNIPLAQITDWLLQLAPQGLVEFVPKSDPMVQELLRLRADIFPDYSQDYFLNCLRKKAEIVKVVSVTHTGRSLIWYHCHK